jgi:hypothetical protein
MMNKKTTIGTKRSLIKRISFVTILAVFLFQSVAALADSPYEPGYEAPVDSVVAWFYDYCNQNQQARAFWHIVKLEDWYGIPNKMVQIKSEYDLSVIKDAFVFYLRSVTIDNQSSGCTEFLPSYWLGSAANEPNEWEGYRILDRSLSLYMNMGYTQDLFEIADSCFGSGLRTYFAFLWNQLGADYFQHLETEVQTNPDHLVGITIAGYYLSIIDNPMPSKRDPALNILHLASISTSREQRRWVTFQLCDVYLKGYQQVQTDILLLTNDTDEGVKNEIRDAIRSKQYYNNQMMNFLNDE